MRVDNGDVALLELLALRRGRGDLRSDRSDRRDGRVLAHGRGTRASRGDRGRGRGDRERQRGKNVALAVAILVSGCKSYVEVIAKIEA